MAIQEITVDTSVLAGDISELQTALANAQRQLEEMFAEVAELDTMWDGPANEMFNRQFGNDHEKAKNLCKTVDSLIDCMIYAKEYDLCENEVNDIVSSISL